MKPERLNFRASLVPEWSLDPDHRSIERQYQFSCHLEAMAFADRVSKIAWKMDHVPVIVIDDYRVTIKSCTHEIGQLSEKDFDLAEAVDDVVISSGL